VRVEDVTEESRRGVLRVYANPDLPTRVSADGLIGTSGVDPIILRSTRDEGFEVVQPIETQDDGGAPRESPYGGMFFSESEEDCAHVR
jgi:hypothetical protein